MNIYLGPAISLALCSTFKTQQQDKQTQHLTSQNLQPKMQVKNRCIQVWEGSLGRPPRKKRLLKQKTTHKKQRSQSSKGAGECGNGEQREKFQAKETTNIKPSNKNEHPNYVILSHVYTFVSFILLSSKSFPILPSLPIEIINILQSPDR